MATLPSAPLIAPQSATGASEAAPAAPQPFVLQMSEPDRAKVARDLYARHLQGKEKRRSTDLTREKYLLHVDGENDGQWADVWQGSKVWVPPAFGALRLQENTLRPLVENFVAYHCAAELRFAAQAAADKRSRDFARVSTVFGNEVSRRQRLNRVLAGAMSIAACYGYCPVHVAWRDDTSTDEYEPLYLTEQGSLANAMRQGYVDIWPGNPWDTVFNEGATRDSVQRASYGRVVSLDSVKAAFESVPWAEQLRGRKDLPSASIYQRIARSWQSGAMHGTGVVAGGVSTDGQELIYLLCEETAQGVDPEWPQGRLDVVAVSGVADGSQATAGGFGSGSPTLLHRGALPGGRLNFVRFYAGYRFDDVLGKPWVADLDDLQVRLNQYITLAAEIGRKLARPPLAASGDVQLDDDASITDDDVIIKVYGATGRTEFLAPNAQSVRALMDLAEETRAQMFRIGSWQAASQGAANASDPAAKVVAQARLDDGNLATINEDFRTTCGELMQLCHVVAKANMSVPMLVTLTGEDYAYLAEPYIRAEQLSDQPPAYVVVSGYGTTPEAKGQQLLSLVAMVGADGQPLLKTEDFWKLWPDPSLRPVDLGSLEVKKRRTQAVNYAIRTAAEVAEQKMQAMPPEWQGMAAEQGAAAVEQYVVQQFPPLPDDIPEMHIEALSQLTQDPAESPLVRQAAGLRQQRYMMMQQQLAAQAQMAALQMQAATAPDDAEGKGGPGGPPRPKPGFAPGPGGSQTSESVESADKDVRQLTQQAESAA